MSSSFTKPSAPNTPSRTLNRSFSADSPTHEQNRLRFRNPHKVNLLDLAAAALASTLAASKPIQELSGWTKHDNDRKNARLKLDGTIVTDADGAAQNIIVQSLRNVSNQVRIVGEESRKEMEFSKGMDHVSAMSKSVRRGIIKERDRDLSENEAEHLEIFHNVKQEILQRYSEIKRTDKVTNNLDVESTRLSAFVDPLDGTKSYSQGDYDSVSILVAIILDNVPIFGVICKPFGQHDEPSFLESGCFAVYGGLLLNGAFVVGGSECKRSQSFKLRDYCVETKMTSSSLSNRDNSTRKAVISKSRAGGVVGRCIDSLSQKGLLNRQPLHVTGAGVKALSLIAGKECESLWFFPLAGTSLWDIAACDALLRVIGGKISDKHGKEINYSKSRNDAENRDGIIACNDISLHEICVKLYHKENWDTGS